MKRSMAAIVLAVCLPAAASAVEDGLERVDIRVADPGNPGRIAGKLAKLEPFTEVQWDEEAGLFQAACRESVHIDATGLSREIEELDLDVEDLYFEFATVQGRVRDSMGYLYSAPNDLEFPTYFSMHGRRFWEFHGKNPYGREVEMRVYAHMRLGAPADSGGAAPDTCEILRFQVADRIMEQRNK